MKKTILIFSLLLAISFSNAQTISFTEASPQPDLEEIYSGSSDSGDIDGDGDIDLIMTGLTPGRFTALYVNDGNGNFAENEDISMPNASNGLVIFEDLDGDGDLDLFFAGVANDIQEFAHIYLNDGLGDFTLSTNSALPQFSDSGVDLEDVDGDGDVDLLIAAKKPNGDFFADVFLNNGAAIFTPAGSTVFTRVEFGTVEFIDVENDGDADVVISGKQEDGTALTMLYLNDGTGNYNADANSNFVQLAGGTVVDVADIDNDGDFDILMSGATDGFNIHTILYINDGLGKFTELVSADLQNTFAGTNSIADMDNDGDLDIVIIGSQAGGLPNIYNIVYENLRNNVFSPIDTIGGEYIAACVVDDFNGDALVDIIIQGVVNKTTAYWNTSTLSPSLPIELADFQVTNYNKKAKLSWITLSEIDNEGFEIEKSGNGVDWFLLGFVDGENNADNITNYDFVDSDVFTGTYYYRLKQIDFDGDFSYSNVATLELFEETPRIDIYPNPAISNAEIKIKDISGKKVKVEVFNHLGVSVWESKLIQDASEWEKRILFKKQGVFFVLIQVGAEVTSHKLVVLKGD
jgi:hypothetical protein